MIYSSHGGVDTHVWFNAVLFPAPLFEDNPSGGTDEVVTSAFGRRNFIHERDFPDLTDSLDNVSRPAYFSGFR